MGDGRQADFEAVFGPEGVWSELARREGGYLGCECTCESQTERRFRVFDFWLSHREFESFREKFAAEVEKFNMLLLSEGLVVQQELVGTYYASDDDRGDEAVPTQS